jgi:hypothetical protein
VTSANIHIYSANAAALAAADSSYLMVYIHPEVQGKASRLVIAQEMQGKGGKQVGEEVQISARYDSCMCDATLWLPNLWPHLRKTDIPLFNTPGLQSNGSK